MSDRSEALRVFEEVLQEAADALSEATRHPYGPPASPVDRKVAGTACVELCKGDRDKAITLWKLIEGHLGYMPQSCAYTLIRASRTDNLVPDITPADPS